MPDRPVIWVLNGPNLNLLGQREPDVYGGDTLADIENNCRAAAGAGGCAIEFRQSNNEGELVDWIQAAREAAAGLVINPAAYTHTSVALHDALKTLDIPVIEVHISNIYTREPFRHHSYVSPAATGTISGLGTHGYSLAIAAVLHLIDPS